MERKLTQWGEQVKSELEGLEGEINSRGGLSRIEFKQQHGDPRNMYFIGGNGRMYVQPFSPDEQYDVSLSGESLKAELMPRIRALFGGADPRGDKQKNSGKEQPYWRTPCFDKVKQAIALYASTEPRMKG